MNKYVAVMVIVITISIFAATALRPVVTHDDGNQVYECEKCHATRPMWGAWVDDECDVEG